MTPGKPVAAADYKAPLRQGGAQFFSVIPGKYGYFLP